MNTGVQMNAAGMPVYLDHASTTPVDPRVAARMAEVLNSETEFGNAASASHDYGGVARALV
jgi:cysteine desulfurase